MWLLTSFQCKGEKQEKPQPVTYSSAVWEGIELLI